VAASTIRTYREDVSSRQLIGVSNVTKAATRDSFFASTGSKEEEMNAERRFVYDFMGLPTHIQFAIGRELGFVIPKGMNDADTFAGWMRDARNTQKLEKFKELVEREMKKRRPISEVAAPPAAVAEPVRSEPMKLTPEDEKALDDLERRGVKWVRSNVYPQPCGLCPGIIQSADDCEWHGLGNCVPICTRCDGSGIEPESVPVAEPTQPNICKGCELGVPFSSPGMHPGSLSDPEYGETPCTRTEPTQPSEAWLPTAENINALAEPIRKYIHDIETNCDPAGTVREVTLLRDQNAQLVAALAVRALEREGATKLETKSPKAES
jgi:hypothetical protein